MDNTSTTPSPSEDATSSHLGAAPDEAKDGGPAPLSEQRDALAEARTFDSSVRPLVVELQRAMLAVGRRLVEGREAGHLRALGFASVAHYAETRGIAPPARTHDMARIGEFLHRFPDAENAFLEGQLTLEAAAALCLVADDASEEKWVEAAVAHTSGGFRKMVREEQVERGERLPTENKTFEVRDVDWFSFEDARAQVCRDENCVVSEGEALGVISRHFVRSRDKGRRRTEPLRATPGDPPRIVPGARTIPPLVARKVWRRDEGACRVPGCTYGVWVELSHIQARAAGGCATVENILCLCRTHNVLMETGELVVKGTADNPQFLHRDGSPFGLPEATHPASSTTSPAATAPVAATGDEGPATRAPP